MCACAHTHTPTHTRGGMCRGENVRTPKRDPNRGAGWEGTVVKKHPECRHTTWALKVHPQQRARESEACILNLSRFLDAARRIHSRSCGVEGLVKGCRPLSEAPRGPKRQKVRAPGPQPGPGAPESRVRVLDTHLEDTRNEERLLEATGQKRRIIC